MTAPTRARVAVASVVFALVVLAVLLSLRIRFRAWPEILVPSYLCGRGWLLYRDIKVVHSPLPIGVLAAISRTIGFRAGILRICGFVPLAAILFQLRRHGREREWSLPAHVFAGLSFVATYFAWDGNAIYPEVFLATLAIPIFAALRRGDDSDIRRAGWLLSAALMIKQPSVFAVLFAAAWVLFRRRAALTSFLLRVAALPVACLLFFAAAGSARDFLRWTVVVPLVYYRGRTALGIQPSQTGIVLAGALPLFAAFVLPAARVEKRRDTFLLAGLTLSFALLAFPHFELVHLLAAVPLLAVASGEVLTRRLCEAGPGAGLRDSEGKRGPLPGPSPAGGGWPKAGRGAAEGPTTPKRFVATAGRGGFAPGPALAVIAARAGVALSILLGAVYLATDAAAGEMSFWNPKQDEAVLGPISALPPAPLFLYGLDQNLFPRSGRVPPGGLYSNPDLWVHYLVDGLENRQVRILRDHPETIVLRGTQAPTETPARALPRFLAKNYIAEPFTRDGVERLIPRPDAVPILRPAERRRPGDAP